MRGFIKSTCRMLFYLSMLGAYVITVQCGRQAPTTDGCFPAPMGRRSRLVCQLKSAAGAAGFGVQDT